MTSRLDRFIEDQRLPTAFNTIIAHHFAPLAQWLYEQSSTKNGSLQSPLTIGISGAQGTGKSTLSSVLKIILEENHGWHVVILSLDDIYLSKADRHTLAQTIHPLLQTRGVPGTHDTSLGMEIIEQLKNLKAGQSINLPRFDKAQDDRKPQSDWDVCSDSVDLIILEGWCVGSVAMDINELAIPVNPLEEQEDPDGSWRRHINHQLKNNYHRLFAELDLLLVLQAPDIDSVRRWRLEQEQKLTASSTAESQTMDEQALLRFIQHYERLTLHNLSEMPGRADVVLTLNRHHNVVHTNYKTHAL